VSVLTIDTFHARSVHEGVAKPTRVTFMKTLLNRSRVFSSLLVWLPLAWWTACYFDSLHFLRPCILSIGLVFYACSGYWLVESALQKRTREKGSVWYKSWPAELACGIGLLVGAVVVLTLVFAKDLK
jgi:hypothetical protein